jgi:fructose-bisphosphate aldolase class I
VNTLSLEATAKRMVADGKGLLAIDESTGTCNKRFARWGIPQTEETRRQYRELIVNTPVLDESISGAILYDETIRQKKNDGTPFAKALAAIGILPGIKVDVGAKKMAGFPGEKVTGRPGWPARSTGGVCADGRAFRKVEGGLRHR